MHPSVSQCTDGRSNPVALSSQLARSVLSPSEHDSKGHTCLLFMVIMDNMMFKLNLLAVLYLKIKVTWLLCRCSFKKDKRAIDKNAICIQSILNGLWKKNWVS